MFAHPRPAIVESRPERVAEAIASLAAAEQVSEVVVGLPLTMSGAESEQTASARAFARLLRKHCTVPVSAWDERLTSVQAERTVKGAANRKAGEVDSAAAVLILQAVLDARRTRVTP